MTKQFYLFSILIFWAELLVAQINQGSRLTAMGNTGAAVKDVWGVAANPATINVAFSSIQLSHQEHSFSKSIRNQAIAGVFPHGRQAFGIHLQRYGIPEYHQLQAGILASKQFGSKLALGLRANYHQLKIENYGTSTDFSVDAGAYYQFTDQLSIGLYFNNISKEIYRTQITHHPLPAKAYIGVAYRTTTKLLLASTMSNDNVALGMDYQLVQAFSLRGGISINPVIHYFGIGFSKSKFLAELTVTKPSRFSYSPQLTIGYVF